MKLQLAMIFGEHMVLQRDQEIKVWGKSCENDTVTVELNEQTEKAETVKGNWMVTLKPEEANEKTFLRVTSKKTGESIQFNDVAIGEVWLAGGQSNMEFLMKYDYDFTDTCKLENDDLLRYFCYPHVPFHGYLDYNDIPDEGYWRKWTDEKERSYFSAIATYMSMTLRKKLNVPVGIINCNWGGSPALAWADPKKIEDDETFKTVVDWQKRNLENTDWPKYITASEKPLPEKSAAELEFENKFMMGEDMTEFFKNFDPSKMPQPDYALFALGPRSVVRPGGLYETMLKPIAPYGIKGALWYQGEDDDAREWVDFYDKSVKAMIESWRELWGYKFPFIIIELAPFMGVGVTGAKRYDDMRKKQDRVAEEVKNVHPVCILDAGEQYNIHPRHKKVVGKRVGNIVMKHVYGDDSLTADCPRAVSAERKENEITVRFINSAEGLKVKGDLREELKVQVNGQNVDFEYEVSNDKLKISAELNGDKAVIRYCISNWCIARLFNSEDNPAFGFEYEV